MTAPRPVSPRSLPHRPVPRSPVVFLTVAEVAQQMRVSKMTVYRLVNAGDLTAIRVGRSVRVPERALTDFLRAAQTDVPS